MSTSSENKGAHDDKQVSLFNCVIPVPLLVLEGLLFGLFDFFSFLAIHKWSLLVWSHLVSFQLILSPLLSSQFMSCLLSFPFLSCLSSPFLFSLLFSFLLSSPPSLFLFYSCLLSFLFLFLSNTQEFSGFIPISLFSDYFCCAPSFMIHGILELNIGWLV